MVPRRRLLASDLLSAVVAIGDRLAGSSIDFPLLLVGASALTARMLAI